MRLDVIHNDRCCLSALLVAHNAERITTKKCESGFLPWTAINTAGLHGVDPKEKPPAYKVSGLEYKITRESLKFSSLSELHQLMR